MSSDAGNLNQAAETCRTNVEGTIQPQTEVTRKYEEAAEAFDKGIAALEEARLMFEEAGKKFLGAIALVGPIQQTLDEAHVASLPLQQSAQEVNTVPDKVEGLKSSTEELYNDLNSNAENCASHVSGVQHMIDVVQNEGALTKLSQDMQTGYSPAAADIVRICAAYRA